MILTISINIPVIAKSHSLHLFLKPKQRKKNCQKKLKRNIRRSEKFMRIKISLKNSKTSKQRTKRSYKRNPKNILKLLKRKLQVNSMKSFSILFKIRSKNNQKKHASINSF